MALIRITLDLAIPEPVYDAIPDAKKLAVRTIIQELKALAVKINEGQLNEEMTTRAVWHRCHHDEANPQPCEEQEI